eukprot:gene12051-16233_t
MRFRGEPPLGRRDDDRDVDDDRAVSLGAILHWFLSLKAALGRRRSGVPRGVGAPRFSWRALLRRAEDDDAIEKDDLTLPPARTDLRREPAIDRPRTAPRPDARRPMEPIALDEDEDPTFDMADEDDDPPPPARKPKLMTAAEAADRIEPA